MDRAGLDVVQGAGMDVLLGAVEVEGEGDAMVTADERCGREASMCCRTAVPRRM